MSSIAIPTSDVNADSSRPTRTRTFEKRLAKRYRDERNFRLLGLAAVGFSVAVLVFLLGNMLVNGIGGFQRAELAVTIDF
ncbi:MAG: phosphate ABC transporter, permease protein PstA, partial [Alphaproteobacteria bacterium HGW-Alphaproteobacteria-15]